jgi:hypothetical protein
MRVKRDARGRPPLRLAPPAKSCSANPGGIAILCKSATIDRLFCAGRKRTVRWSLVVALPLLWLAAPARAQTREPRGDLSHVIGQLIESLSSTRGRVFDFLETVELWDAEGEIDRLVGNPWELHDSTQYKLRLLPLRLTYPAYSRIVAQMTRLDDLRGLRIQNVSPDSVDNLAVTFDTLSADRRPEDFAGALLGQFSAREYADLGVFALSHQPFFPRNDEEWRHFEYQLGQNKYAVAGGALALGAAFNAGALATSGGITRTADRRFGLGWYGGIRSFGMRMQPQLRGGLTLKAPAVEMAVGLWERVRPADTDRRTALEVAFREGWLSRLSRPTGWDAFFEAAFRRVLQSQPGYTGERGTARLGLFARKERPLRLRNLIFRSSAEMESDFQENARFVAGLGFEHVRTGLATVLQSSRTAVVRDGNRTHESRGGLFLAGTVEPPTQFIIDAMHSEARLVREHIQAVAGLRDPSPAELDAFVAPLAESLAHYLEARRLAYSILRWERARDELHGPLDPDLLLQARSLVLERQHTLADFLREAARRLGETEKRATAVNDLAQRDHDPVMVDAYVAELDALDKIRRRESARIGHALFAFQHYHDTLARMAAASELVPERQLDWLPPTDMRRLTAAATPP